MRLYGNNPFTETAEVRVVRPASDPPQNQPPPKQPPAESLLPGQTSAQRAPLQRPPLERASPERAPPERASSERAPPEEMPVAGALGRTPKNPRLAQLARQIQDLRHRGVTPPSRCSTGLDELDIALGGGFLRGAVHELVVPAEGVAAWTVALQAAARAAGHDQWIFYLDTQQELYPPGLVALGVPLGRLIVVRVDATREALWVCEQVLRCRAVAAVVLPLRSLDAYASRRLQLAAETGGGMGLLLCRELAQGHTFAASRLRFDPLVGSPGSRRLSVTVLRQREGCPRMPVDVELADAPDFVPAHALFRDRAGAQRRCAGE